METLDEVLAHHGIRGMKWGVRRKSKSSSSSSSSSHPGLSDDAKRAQDAHAIIKKHGSTNSLSNQELQHLVKRINLEKQYNELVKQHSVTSKGKKIAGEILGQFGKQQAAKALSVGASKAAAAALKK